MLTLRDLYTYPFGTLPGMTIVKGGPTPRPVAAYIAESLSTSYLRTQPSDDDLHVLQPHLDDRLSTHVLQPYAAPTC